MAIYNGDKSVEHIYIGTTPVRAVYIGGNQIWPSDVQDVYKLTYEAVTCYTGGTNNPIIPEYSNAYEESDGTLVLEYNVQDTGDSLELHFTDLSRILVDSGGGIISRVNVKSGDLTLDYSKARLENTYDIKLYDYSEDKVVWIGIRKDDQSRPMTVSSLPEDGGGPILITDNSTGAKLKIYLDAIIS